MRKTIILVSLAVLGCDDEGGCAEDVCLDIASFYDQARGIYGGSFTGTVTDGRTDTTDVYQPCDISGQSFTLSLELSEATSCQEDVGDWDSGYHDCTEAAEGYFHAEGTLHIGEKWQAAVTADITASVREGRLWVYSEFWNEPNAGDLEHFTAQPISGYIDSLSIESFRSERRFSDGHETTWQLCELPISTHET